MRVRPFFWCLLALSDGKSYGFIFFTGTTFVTAREVIRAGEVFHLSFLLLKKDRRNLTKSLDGITLYVRGQKPLLNLVWQDVAAIEEASVDEFPKL